MLSEKPFLILILSLFLISGCGVVGSNNLLGTDPVSGGVDAGVSNLADIPLPNGLQRYPRHGFVSMGANGAKEGLEVLRGQINNNMAAASLFNTLKSAGWQLLAAQSHKSRAFYLYSKDSEYLAITFQPQGSLTVANIWRSPALPDGADLPHAVYTGEIQTSIAPEEYGPLQKGEEPEAGSVIEKWGNHVREREL